MVINTRSSDSSCNVEEHLSLFPKTHRHTHTHNWLDYTLLVRKLVSPVTCLLHDDCGRVYLAGTRAGQVGRPRDPASSRGCIHRGINNEGRTPVCAPRGCQQWPASHPVAFWNCCDSVLARVQGPMFINDAGTLLNRDERRWLFLLWQMLGMYNKGDALVRCYEAK